MNGAGRWTWSPAKAKTMIARTRLRAKIGRRKVRMYTCISLVRLVSLRKKRYHGMIGTMRTKQAEIIDRTCTTSVLILRRMSDYGNG
jgi:hypothetical protein